MRREREREERKREEEGGDDDGEGMVGSNSNIAHVHTCHNFSVHLDFARMDFFWLSQLNTPVSPHIKSNKIALNLRIFEHID